MARKNYKKKAMKKVRKVRISKPIGGDIISKNNYCQITETKETPNLLQENINVKISLELREFPRALAMSKFFRFYRPRIAVYKYEPLYTDYSEGVGGSKPNFLYQMNRSGDEDYPNTKGQFLAMGARPKPFTKPVTIKYRPNLCQALSVATADATPGSIYHIGSVPVYNWVNTWSTEAGVNNYIEEPATFADTGIAITGLATSNNPLWQGHNVYVSVDTPGGATTNICREYCTVVWEFKDPLCQDKTV